MDPVANIKRQRSIISEMIEGEVQDRLDDPYAQELTIELIELVRSLDEWRSKGGFDPYELAPELRELNK